MANQEQAPDWHNQPHFDAGEKARLEAADKALGNSDWHNRPHLEADEVAKLEHMRSATEATIATEGIEQAIAAKKAA